MNFPLLRALWEHPEMSDSLQQFWVQQFFDCQVIIADRIQVKSARVSRQVLAASIV